MTYRLISLAADDLAQAVRYYENQNIGLGAQFLDEFEAAMVRICLCPRAWMVVSKNHRRHLFRRFPYAVFYSCDGTEIIVAGVMHLRMNPETQKERVEKA